MFESISEAIQSVFRRLGAKGKLTQKNIQDGLREVRLALLQADVNYRVVKDFIDRITQKAIGQEVIRHVQPSQQIVKIVYDEMVNLMGPVEHTLRFRPDGPTIIMMVGLQGGGKTTTCVKFARYLIKRYQRKPILVAADMQRPAAVDQICMLGKQHNIPAYSERLGSPTKICQNAASFATRNGYDTVILDTAGRLHINQELMEELRQIKVGLNPSYILLVADAMTGQDAVNSAGEFNRLLDINGVILTKLDGDARGGAALSIKAVTGKPILFVGVGERVDNFEEFYPDRMASRILGMGDIVSLVEKAQQVVDLEYAAKIQQKLLKDEFTLQDLYEQLQQVKRMGPIGEIIKLIPGLGGMAQDVSDDEMKHMEAILLSMTPDERQHPEILNKSRLARIAKGSGVTLAMVNSLVKQFQVMRSMIRDVKKGKINIWKLMKGGM
jgi:signal recognition particle subunit SRP54